MSKGYYGILNYSDTLFDTRTSAAAKANGIISGKIKRVLDGVGSMSFTLSSTNPKASTVAVGDAVQVYRNNSNNFVFYGFIKNVELDIYGNASVTVAEQIYSIKLSPKLLIYDEWDKFQDAIWAWDGAVNSSKIDDYNWGYIYNQNDMFEKKFVLVEGSGMNGLELLEEILTAGTRWGDRGTYHFWCADRYYDTTTYEKRIHIKSESSMITSTQSVEIGKNITDISIEKTIPDATIINVSGKDFDDKDVTFTGYGGATNVVANTSYVSKYKIYGDVDFGSGYTATTLQNIAQNYIREYGKPQTTYTIQAVDLYWDDDSNDPFEIGQLVKVKVPRYSIDETVPIKEIDIDIANPLRTTISIGSEQPRITSDYYISELMKVN